MGCGLYQLDSVETAKCCSESTVNQLQFELLRRHAVYALRPNENLLFCHELLPKDLFALPARGKYYLTMQL